MPSGPRGPDDTLVKMAPIELEGNPASLTHRIQSTLLTRHPVTLPAERARNYAELAAHAVVNDYARVAAWFEWAKDRYWDDHEFRAVYAIIKGWGDAT